MLSEVNAILIQTQNALNHGDTEKAQISTGLFYV